MHSSTGTSTGTLVHVREIQLYVHACVHVHAGAKFITCTAVLYFRCSSCGCRQNLGSSRHRPSRGGIPYIPSEFTSIALQYSTPNPRTDVPVHTHPARGAQLYRRRGCNPTFYQPFEGQWPGIKFSTRTVLHVVHGVSVLGTAVPVPGVENFY